MRYAALALVLCVGCSSEPPFLVVDFATDVPAGASFVTAEARLFQGSTPLDEQLIVARLGENLVEPRRLATFTELERGAYRVDVVLTDLAGDEVARRSTLVRVERATAITVVVSVSCVGLRCPSTGDSSDATACHGGVCVDPRCSEAQPELCTGACSSDVECDGGRCVVGVCLADEGAGCDDGDPCTDDAEGPDGCTHVPNEAPCDDGVFCNGADRCEAGVCVAMGGPPCAAERCDEVLRRCETGCVSQADCPADVLGEWTACAGFSGECGEDGMRARSVTAFTCDAGACVPGMDSEVEPCARETDGDGCDGGRSCDEWRDCVFADCATEGRRVRFCHTPSCVAGECDSGPTETEQEVCTRDAQDGLSCRPPGSLCEGRCADGTCGDLCVHCAGACTVVGCRTGGC